MNKVQLLGCVLALLFGIFMFIYGGSDDSPGAQLIGVIAFIIGVIGIVKARRSA